MKTHRIVVVGAGMAGLAAALDLCRQGLEVIVLDRAGSAGGKLRETTVGAAQIDAGPTVFTMRWVFDGLFHDAGTCLADHLTLLPAEILARHAWSETERLDLFADPARTEDAIGRFAGAAEARGYRSFRAESRRIYETLEQTFIAAPRPSAASLVRSVARQGLAAFGRSGRSRRCGMRWAGTSAIRGCGSCSGGMPPIAVRPPISPRRP